MLTRPRSDQHSITATRPEFARLNAPSDNGGVLVDPPAATLRAMLDASRGLIAGWDVPIVDMHLQEVRRAVRQRVTSVEDDRPVVMTGHQPEFIHPGVWAKHIVVQRLAEAVGGVGVNLIVDSDAARQVALAVPTWREDCLTVEPIPFTNRPAGTAYEALPRLERATVGAILRQAQTLLGPCFESTLLSDYLEALAGADQAQDFVDQMVAGRSAIERGFGIELLERRVSRSWCCPLLVEMLNRAPEFVTAYNDSLAAYRRALGIRGSRRPIPDLQVEPDRLELPIWVLSGHGPRQRLLIALRGEAVELYAGRRSLGVIERDELRRWDRAREAFDRFGTVAFRPRALTLMLWARMLLADLFIHGIGGAKYDRITDLLIQRYFGVAPPPFGCVSATLRLDLPVAEVTPGRLRAWRHELRDMACNPQRHLELDGPAAALATERRQLVARAEQLRREQPDDHAARRTVFQGIRTLNERLLAQHPESTDRLRRCLERGESELSQNRVATSREYFFALFGRPALDRLCTALPAMDGFRL